MTSDAPIRPAARPVRRGRLAAAAASIAGSALVHGAFAMVAAGVAWHVSGTAKDPGREVTIHFDDPGMSEESDTLALPVPAAPERSDVLVAHAPAPIPVAPALPHAADAPDHPAAPRQLPPTLLAQSPSAATPAAATPPDAATTVMSEGDPGLPGGVRFAGLGASNARSVVYVVDASGPMVTSLPRVLQEVARSAEQLGPSQKFGVVLFRATDDGTGVESFSPVLVRATPTAKRTLAEWLAKVEPRGASNPLAGLEAALELKPDAVFLLSRSIARSGGGVWEQGLEATLNRLDELNPRVDGPASRRAVLIQTIQFLDDDPTGIMQTIASHHGQSTGYRVVRRSEDLGRNSR